MITDAALLVLRMTACLRHGDVASASELATECIAGDAEIALLAAATLIMAFAEGAQLSDAELMDFSDFIRSGEALLP